MSTEEKILVSRKRKRKPNFGHRIAISDEVHAFLEKKRQGKSWDAWLRKAFGLPKRNGDKQPIIEGYVETTTGRFFLDEQDAYEVAIMSAAKAGTKKVNKPMKVREIV